MGIRSISNIIIKRNKVSIKEDYTVENKKANNNKKTMGLAEDTLKFFEKDSEWLGYGYLGSSYRTVDTDRYLIKAANHYNMSKEDLFMWCNSKYGRWAAENSGYGHITLKKLKEILPKEINSLRVDEGLPEIDFYKQIRGK